LNSIFAGKQDEVDRIFMRIERYAKMITDASFLKFDGL